MKIIIILALVSTSVLAFDFNEALQKVKNKIHELTAPEKVVKKKKFVMPAIPKVTGNATSTGVYDESGPIYQQGEAFKKLSLEEKRKYRVAFLQELYLVVYESEGSVEQIKESLNVLEGGGHREGVYRSLVLGNDYATLEGYNTTPNDKLINFVVSFGQEYMQRKFNPDLLRKINLYGIKRILTEKLLEIIDVFPKDGKDLKIWYALVSSHLSQKFPNLWEGKVRSSIHPEVHHKWAGTVPFQHIKSEIIIKIHKSLNSIQK